MCDCAFPYRCPAHRPACTCRANQPCDYHSELERERANTARRMQQNRHAAVRQELDASPTSVTRSAKQTSFEIGPEHWVAVRYAPRGPWIGWNVVEIADGVSTLDSWFSKRVDAEVVGAALAAMRSRNLTDGDHR